MWAVGHGWVGVVVEMMGLVGLEIAVKRIALLLGSGVLGPSLRLNRDLPVPRR